MSVTNSATWPILRNWNGVPCGRFSSVSGTVIAAKAPGGVDGGILALDRPGDRFFQRTDRDPFVLGPHDPFRADLIDPPVNLQQMPVGVTEFDDQLHARAAPAVEIDRNL